MVIAKLHVILLESMMLTCSSIVLYSEGLVWLKAGVTNDVVFLTWLFRHTTRQPPPPHTLLHCTRSKTISLGVLIWDTFSSKPFTPFPSLSPLYLFLFHLRYSTSSPTFHLPSIMYGQISSFFVSFLLIPIILLKKLISTARYIFFFMDLG